jgi:Protein of unknown function (DUF1573)
MKTVFFVFSLLVAILVLPGCGSDEPPRDLPITMPPTEVRWDEITFDYGDIPEDKEVSHKFYFTNTGDKPLKIFGVKPSCSCTAGDYSDAEVAPGEKGFVELKFNPSGKTGTQAKQATVKMNVPDSMQVIKFKATIAKK